MSFYGDGIAAALPGLRDAARERMTDTVVVERDTGQVGPLNKATMTQERVYEEQFTSPARFKAAPSSRDSQDIGGSPVALQHGEIHLPWDCPQVRDNAIVRFTAVGTGSDPRLIGQRFVVGAPMNGSQQTATRLVVKEAL